MKKIIIAIVIIILAFVGFAYINNQKPESAGLMNTDNSMEKSDGTKNEIEPSMGNGDRNETLESARSYMPYSKTVLSETTDGKRVLFFYANWCPTCRPVDQSLVQEYKRLPDNTTVIRVNYNDSDTDSDEKELARKYGITYQHTFVQIDSGGNEIAKWNGGGIDQLISNLK